MYILDRQIENRTRRRNHVYKGPIGTAKRASNPTKSLIVPSHSEVLLLILPASALARVSPADQLLSSPSPVNVLRLTIFVLSPPQIDEACFMDLKSRR